MKQDVYGSGTQTLDSPQRAQAGTQTNDKAEYMRKAEEAGKPGAPHKALDVLVGKWVAEVKCWMEPGGPPNVSHGTADVHWILNGRFVEENFHGDMMGKPFNGRSTLGFDNMKQKYRSVWVDDMKTSIMLSEGKSDGAFKVITLEGKADCPATGQTDVPMKTVLRLLGPDKHVLEMFDGSKGADARVMEITYTRQ